MAITNGYATDAQLKAALGATNDDQLAQRELSIEAASRQLDGWCGRRFWVDATAVDRQFWADDPRCLPVDDISSTTGLVVKIDTDGDGTFETTLTIATDFILLPANAADEVPVWPYTEVWLADNYYWPRLSNGRPGVQVTAKFGWPAVPDDIEKACIIQATQLFKAKDAAFGVADFDGGAMRITAGLHPTAKALAAPYRKAPVG